MTSGAPALLLELTIDGRVYRWTTGTRQLEIEGHLYTPGLADTAAEEGASSVALSVTDPSLDWPTLAPLSDAGSAVLRRWRTDQALAEALLLCAGEWRIGGWGARTDTVTGSIVQRGELTLGTPMPDAAAQVSRDTWPLPVSSGVEVVQEGRTYPIIFGYPGFLSADRPIQCVVPVPVAQQLDGSLGRPTESGTIVVIAEDGALPITQVRMQNGKTGAVSNETVSFQNDALYRPIRKVQFASGSETWPDPADGDPELYAGFSPSGGGGPRTAYDVLDYGARHWGGASLDRSRLPEVRPLLESFLVDTWVDNPKDNMWAFFEDTLLPFLPVEIRQGRNGRYLVEQRYRSDPRRQVGAVSIDDGDGAIADALALSDSGPFSEFVANYRPARTRAWLGQAKLTGREGLASVQLVGLLGFGTGTISVSFSSLCSRSASRYGNRPAPTIDLDWCWDEGTALRVLRWMAERDALPATLVSYALYRDDLREGEEVRLTDTRRGLVDVAAIVTGPPRFSARNVLYDFRIPP